MNESRPSPERSYAFLPLPDASSKKAPSKTRPAARPQIKCRREEDSSEEGYNRVRRCRPTGV
jgi:hypothetical protein